jgi:hypothetical protein
MKSRTIGILLATVTILALLWAAGSAVASPPPAEPGGDVTVAGTVASKISYQGVLKENGSPVTGSRNMTFRLYSNSACSTQVGSDIVKSGVQVSNGLFSVDLNVSQTHFNGQGLWLQVRVGSTNLGCEEILPVPYALSLRPGAEVMGEAAYVIWAANTATTGNAHGIHGTAVSPDGIGGLFNNFGGGVAIAATGTGIIQSTAKSYIWISGNNLQKSDSDDTTEFEYDLYGGYKVYGGSDWVHNKTVLLPVTIPGQLYGQDVTVTGLDLYYQTSDEFTGITITAMRRQNGVGTGDLIFRDEGDHVCPDAPCTLHWDLSQNNVLSDQQGILYIAMSLDFISATSYVQIGGARLTLEHD